MNRRSCIFFAVLISWMLRITHGGLETLNHIVLCYLSMVSSDFLKSCQVQLMCWTTTAEDLKVVCRGHRHTVVLCTPVAVVV